MAAFKGWEVALLRRMHAPVTKSNVRFLRAWQRAEGGTASFNPLNTTQRAPGAGSYNSVGVRRYRSPQQGIEATVQTLLNGRYGGIVQGLRSGRRTPMQLAQAEARTPWGTGEGIMRVLGSTHGPLGPPVQADPRAALAAVTGPRTRAYTRGPARAITQALYNPAQAQAFNAASEILGVPQFDFSQLTRTIMKPGQRRPLPLSQAQPRNPVSIGSMGVRGKGTGRVTIAPGADRSGVKTKPIVFQALSRVSQIAGIPIRITTGSNHSQMTTSGNVSDHWSGHAADIGVPVDSRKGDRIAAAALMSIGVPRARAAQMAKRGGLYTINYRGHRYQVIWKTYQGGNHHNHVHFGVA